jgi:hypothetical protein
MQTHRVGRLALLHGRLFILFCVAYLLSSISSAIVEKKNLVMFGMALCAPDSKHWLAVRIGSIPRLIDWLDACHVGWAWLQPVILIHAFASILASVPTASVRVVIL